MKVTGEKFDYSTQRLADLPEYLLLETTNRCNLRCPTCSRETLTRIGTMSYARFRTIMEQLPTVKHVKLHGLGETFLAPDLIPMLQYLKERQAEVVLITNGNWKTTDYDAILAHTRFLYFSVDGFDKPTYEEARVGGKWETVIANIEKFAARKQAHDCHLLINFVCHRENAWYMPRMVELCHNLGIDALRINVVQSWVSPDDFPEKFAQLSHLFVHDVAPFIRYYKEALKLGKQYDFDVEVIGNEEFSHNQCIWPFERTYITWEGEMVPCCMRPDPIYSVGNILKSDVRTVWHNARLHEIRTKLQADQPTPFCTACPYKLNAAFLKQVRTQLLADQEFTYNQANVLNGNSFTILRNIIYHQAE